MEIASLDDAPDYAAVSYVWGQKGKVSTISVGKSTLEVSASSERVLRYFSQQKVVVYSLFSKRSDIADIS
jgi:hypothetical protein